MTVRDSTGRHRQAVDSAYLILGDDEGGVRDYTYLLVPKQVLLQGTPISFLSEFSMDATTIIVIHEYLTEYYMDSDDPIVPSGIKSQSTIESAAARPDSTVGGKDAYTSVFMKAAALFHSIVNNHSFHNGNKRVALLSALYYLGEHGWGVEQCTDDEMFEFTRRAAAHELCADRKEEVAAIAAWFEDNSRKFNTKDFPLKFLELKSILENFGFSLIENGKRYDVVLNGKKMESILKKGRHGVEPYDPVYITNLRKRLGLTIDQGIDSARFYGQKGVRDQVGEFMKLRIVVMNLLASC